MSMFKDSHLVKGYFESRDNNSIRSLLWSPVVVGLTLVIYALSKTANGLLFSYAIASVAVISILYFSNAHPPQQLFKQQTYSSASLWSEAVDDTVKLDQEDQCAKLELFHPPLTKSVEQLLDYFYRDFVESWWNPLQSGYDYEFEKSIKLRLNAAMTSVEKTLLKQERNDIVMSIMYGLANTLIIHMRECRTFEMSEIPMDDYVIENPHSPFAQLLSKKEQHHQLRGLSNTILKRILPVTDMNSRVVNSLLKELLATHLFGNIITTCSDPDFINAWIVQYLSDTSHEETAIDNIDRTAAEVDGLRSLVEKATEDAMAAEQKQQRGSEQSSSNIIQFTHQGHQQQQQKEDQRQSNSTTSSADNSFSNVQYHHTSKSDDDTLVSVSSLPSPSSIIPSASHILSHSQQSNLQRSVTPVDNSKRRMTLSKADEEMLQSPMIYAYGTVSFSIMDVSPPPTITSPHDNNQQLDKLKLMYIIQIERPAMQETPGSEGGGYVITRTYNDFEVFQLLMKAKHGKRVARLNLRLPLEVTWSWLRKKRPVIGNNGTSVSSVYASGTGSTNNHGNEAEAVSHGLEHYLGTVVADAELGRDPLILAFLRKERATENGTTQKELPFAEEYKDEVLAYTATPLAVDTTMPSSMGSRAKSLFTRSGSISGGSSHGSSSSTNNMSPQTKIGSQATNGDSDGNGDFYFKRKHINKIARQGSISSMKSSSDSLSSRRDSDDDQPELHSDESSHHQHREYDSATSMSASDASLMATEVDDSLSEIPPPSPSPSTLPNASEKSASQKPLSAMDTELLIETTFALIVEIFDLTTANNKAWMRRSLLNLLREIVRRSYTELVAKQYNDYMQAYLSPDALVGWSELIKERFWPNGSFISSEENSHLQRKRTDKEKKQTEHQAKVLLVQRAIPGGVRQLIGDQNCTLAMERIWGRLQDEELNRVLVLQILERVIRPLFG